MSINRRMDLKMCSIYTMEYYSTVKRDEVLKHILQRRWTLPSTTKPINLFVTTYSPSLLLPKPHTAPALSTLPAFSAFRFNDYHRVLLYYNISTSNGSISWVLKYSYMYYNNSLCKHCPHFLTIHALLNPHETGWASTTPKSALAKTLMIIRLQNSMTAF